MTQIQTPQTQTPKLQVPTTPELTKLQELIASHSDTLKEGPPAPPIPFNIREVVEVEDLMYSYNSIFYAIFSISEAYFDESIPVGAVDIDTKKDTIVIRLNPNIWEEMSSYEKTYLIAHECMHILLEHSKIFSQYQVDPELAGLAADISVNETLSSYYGFEYSLMPLLQEHIATVDTVFGDNAKHIPKNKSALYYYALMQKDPPMTQPPPGLDSHSGGEGEDEAEGNQQSSGKELSDELKEQIKQAISENSNQKDLNNLREATGNHDDNGESSVGGQSAGTSPGLETIPIPLQVVKKKPKWEQVIKKWAKDRMKESDDPSEQWIMPNRRLLEIPDVILPSEYQTDHYAKDKMDIWFFQDVSGSCRHLADRFFKAAQSIPEERFNIRSFCFDTVVHEVDYKKGEVKGGGGTFFYIMEQCIQDLIRREGVKYPSAVFVITDGYGDKFTCEYPDRWYWFLTEDSYYSSNGYYDACVPQGSHKFALKDYE